jgi:hypothetical protein
MNRRIPLVAAAASGGMLAAAFLPAVAAFADSGEGSGPTDNAFTIDGTTFDPGKDGYDDVHALFGNAPLLQIGGGAALGQSLASQDLDVYNGDGDQVGSVATDVTDSNLFGIESAQFTVTDVTNANIDTDASAADLASALNASSVDFDSYDDVDTSDIADALADNSSGSILGGDLSAKTITNVIGPDGSDTVDFDKADFSAQDIADALNAANGGDELPTDGTVYSITNLGAGLGLSGDSGIYNIYEAVPGSGDEAATITDTLVTPLGNFDLSTPFDATTNIDPTDSFKGLDDPSQHTLSDGSGGLGGLLGGAGGDDDNTGGDETGGDKGGGDDKGSGGDTETNSIAALAENDDDTDNSPSDNAFTLGGVTYDPGSDGWDKPDTLFSDSPLLQIAGGHLNLPFAGTVTPVDLSTQDFTLYDASGDEIGEAKSNPVTAGDILGVHVTQFTVGGGADGTVTPADPDEPSDALPADGTTISVADFGGGFENVYEATPNDDGDAAASITDTLVTPFGNIDLSTDFDAIADLDPGSATDGVDTASGSDPLGGLGDIFSGSGGLGDLLGGSGDGAGSGDEGDGGDIPGSAASSGGDLSSHAFTIGDSTFDPGSDGWDSVSPVSGLAPIMEIGGASLHPAPLVNQNIDLATQNLEVYNNDGDDVGGVSTAVNTSNILGIDTTQFTVDGLHASTSDIQSALGDSGDISFAEDAPVSESDVASILAGNLDIGSGDISSDDVIGALADADFADDLGITTDVVGNTTFDAGDVADGIQFDPSDVASALNGNLDTADLPDVGTVYSVTDLGFLGIHNVYEAVPADGDGSPTITDTLITPLGNFDLSTMFNAVAELDPGNAVAGASDSGGGLFDGLGDLFDGDDSGASDASASVSDFFPF